MSLKCHFGSSTTALSLQCLNKKDVVCHIVADSFAKLLPQEIVLTRTDDIHCATKFFTIESKKSDDRTVV